MSTVSMCLSRCLALCFLCLASAVFAAPVCTGTYGTASTPAAVCATYNRTIGGKIYSGGTPLENGQCLGVITFLENGQVADPAAYIGSYSCTCSTYSTTYNLPTSLALGGLPQSTQQCVDNCVEALNVSASQALPNPPDDPVCSYVPNDPAGTGSCKFVFTTTGATCNLPMSPPGNGQPTTGSGGSGGTSGTGGTGTGGTGTGGTGTGGTGTGGTGTGGTGTGGTGTGGTGTGGTGTGGTGTGGTGTGGTGTGGTGTGGNNGSGTDNGTCTQAPCGTCDPTTQTCGNTFGGNCKTDFQCQGDAIQCAVAAATNKAECLLKSLKIDTDTDPAFLEGKAAFDGGTSALGTQGGIQVANGGNIGIDSSNPFSSSCPSDYPLFEYKGQSYVFPFSKYCNIFQIMGNIMLLIASLISMKIIMKKDD